MTKVLSIVTGDDRELHLAFAKLGLIRGSIKHDIIAIKMEIGLEEKVPKKMSLPPTRQNSHKLMQIDLVCGSFYFADSDNTQSAGKIL